MKWTEPWSATRKLQARFDPFGLHQLKSAFRWFMLFALLWAGMMVLDGGVDYATLSRLWVAFPLAYVLSLALYAVQWLSRCKVSTGPAGILRHKGEAMHLLPWQSIRSWEFTIHDGHDLLRIKLADPEGYEAIFIPSGVDKEAINAELLGKARNASPSQSKYSADDALADV